MSHSENCKSAYPGLYKIFQIWPLNLKKKELPAKTRTEVVPLGLNPDTVQDTQVI